MYVYVYLFIYIWYFNVKKCWKSKHVQFVLVKKNIWAGKIANIPL